MNSNLKTLIRARELSVFGHYQLRKTNITATSMTEYELFNDLILGKDVDVALSLFTPALTHYGLNGVMGIVGFGGEGHKDLWKHTRQVVKQSSNVRVVRIAALYHDVGKPDAFRKKEKITFHGHEKLSVKKWKQDSKNNPLFPDKEENKRIALIIEGLEHVESYDSSWTDSAVRRVHSRFSSVWNDLIDLAFADVTTQNKTKGVKIRKMTEELHSRAVRLEEEQALRNAHKLPKGLGNTLMERFGLKGAALGTYMHKIQELVVTDRLAIADIESWINENPPV